MRARLLAPAVVTATVLCGCNASADRPAPRPPAVASASAAPVIPLGVLWHLAEYRLPGEPRVLVAYDSTLTFEPARYDALACNSYEGPFVIAGDRIDLQGGGASQIACNGGRGELEKAFFRMVRNDVRWRLDGPRLTLRADDGATFLYESGDALAPGSGHTVVEGVRRGRRYRVWTVGRGNEVVLRAGVLNLAGRGGDDRSLANPHVDPYARGAGGSLGPREGLAAGFAPVGTVRMTYRRTKGGTEVELPLYPVPGVRWPVFAGITESGSVGWSTTAYDARGRTLAPYTGKQPYP